MGPDGHGHRPCRRAWLLRTLRFQHGVDLLEGVGEPRAEVGAAAVLHEQFEVEGAVPLLLVDVCDGAHEWAQNDFCVVLEKVYLEKEEVNYMMLN